MEEQRATENDDRPEILYKTKVVQFLGRSTPIILQNDNGPCPLLAVCNVLLLRNSLSLGVGDSPEFPLQKLLSLIAEKLIDSNSNIQDKDDGYVFNQQQNIADAIDLLPRLATGIDVNVQFRKINDFEFTRECAIFDLFDIGLYHGWIVDPQDTETASAIGSKSYNTLVGELVAFETSNSASKDKNLLEEDSVDFAVATTAALGVPSPCLSRGRSFDDRPTPVQVDQISGKGDREEVEELIRALNLSKVVTSNPVDVSFSPEVNSFDIPEESSGAESLHNPSSKQIEVEGEKTESKDDGLSSNIITCTENDALLSNTYIGSKIEQLVSQDLSPDVVISNESAENGGSDQLMPSGEDQSISKICAEDLFTSQIQNPNVLADGPIDCNLAVFSAPAAPTADVHLENGTKELDASEGGSSSLDDSEPIYEGEECILDPGLPKYEEREPVYEGEVVLAQQADKMEKDVRVQCGDQVALKQCHLIKNFLENSASQLTIYGLFCLQDGLKERELCVFFRNNHFNTMFKFNGELYLLATDQGYINQPDLVWEKLNEVNGDTQFMTGNFTEFKIENQVSESWNEQNVLTSTADYLATLEASKSENSSFNSDLQLAIALQQQEFEQQPQLQSQRQQQQSSQQPPISGRSRLFTGPQVSTRTSHNQRTESKKEKDKCSVM